MNRKRLSAALMTLLVLTSVIVIFSMSSVQAQSTKADYTGEAILSALVDPGLTWFRGGVEHIRDQVIVFRDDCTDPRVNGYNTLVTNWNINTKTGVVIMGGKFSFDVDGVEGGWEGTFTGNNIDDGILSIHLVGHGTGELVGLKIVMWAEDRGIVLPEADLSGYILDPHGG
jgi:hypothetical protein